MTLSAKIESARWRFYEWQARQAVKAAWRNPPPQQPSPVHDPVIVSLTSYPKRYGTLALTLKSLLRQTMKPEAILLWIAEGDMAALPDDVRALEAEGVSIRPCEDIRSFKKFAFALRDFPDHRIAICDDDSWYWPQWLETLAVPLPPDQIACHRMHRIALDKGGTPLPYDSWDQGTEERSLSPLNYATGVGGVLFRLKQFDPRVLDMATATALCPSADDIWIYFMARLAGSSFTRVGDNHRLISWRSSQESALWRVNNAGLANDRQFAAMLSRFPSIMPSAPSAPLSHPHLASEAHS